MENKNYYPLRPGKFGGSIVSDVRTVKDMDDNSGHTDVEFYGGHLVAESIPSGDLVDQLVEAYNEKYGPKEDLYTKENYTIDEQILFIQDEIEKWYGYSLDMGLFMPNSDPKEAKAREKYCSSMLIVIKENLLSIKRQNESPVLEKKLGPKEISSDTEKQIKFLNRVEGFSIYYGSGKATYPFAKDYGVIHDIVKKLSMELPKIEKRDYTIITGNPNHEPTLEEQIGWLESLCNGVTLTNTDIIRYILKNLLRIQELKAWGMWKSDDKNPFGSTVEDFEKEDEIKTLDQQISFIDSLITPDKKKSGTTTFLAIKKSLEILKEYRGIGADLANIHKDSYGDSEFASSVSHPEITPEEFRKIMAAQPVQFVKNYSIEGITSQLNDILNKSELGRTPSESLNSIAEKLQDLINSLEQYQGHTGAVHFDDNKFNINPCADDDGTDMIKREITDADIIQTALQEGSITPAQSLRLMEIQGSPEFEPRLLQMQYQNRADKLTFKLTQEFIQKESRRLFPQKENTEPMVPEEVILSELTASIRTITKFLGHDSNVFAIKDAARIMREAVTDKHKLLSCGNGGSYSDAQHFASELSGKYRGVRPAIAAMALSDGGAMSCIANDFGFNHVFERQVEAIGLPGDVLLCLSTSGNSANVILAAKKAREIGITTIGICGNSGGDLKKYLDVMIEIPHSGSADRIQELSIVIIHILVNLIERGI